MNQKKTMKLCCQKQQRSTWIIPWSVYSVRKPFLIGMLTVLKPICHGWLDLASPVLTTRISRPFLKAEVVPEKKKKKAKLVPIESDTSWHFYTKEIQAVCLGYVSLGNSHSYLRIKKPLKYKMNINCITIHRKRLAMKDCKEKNFTKANVKTCMLNRSTLKFKGFFFASRYTPLRFVNIGPVVFT